MYLEIHEYACSYRLIAFKATLRLTKTASRSVFRRHTGVLCEHAESTLQ